MKTNDEKDTFWAGFFIGAFAAAALIVLSILIVTAKHKKNRYNPNYLLNSKEWKIDTVTTVVNSKDTTTVYKFRKL